MAKNSVFSHEFMGFLPGLPQSLTWSHRGTYQTADSVTSSCVSFAPPIEASRSTVHAPLSMGDSSSSLKSGSGTVPSPPPAACLGAPSTSNALGRHRTCGRWVSGVRRWLPGSSNGLSQDNVWTPLTSKQTHRFPNASGIERVSYKSDLLRHDCHLVTRNLTWNLAVLV